jgi:hypothetical protein
MMREGREAIVCECCDAVGMAIRVRAGIDFLAAERIGQASKAVALMVSWILHDFQCHSPQIMWI